MKEIIEQLKEEEKKAEKRLANVKMLINISESAKAIMESFSKINEINHDFKKREFDDALSEKLKEKRLFVVGGVIIPSEKVFKEPLLSPIIASTTLKNIPFEVNGKKYKADLQKNDVIYVENDKVWLKREYDYGFLHCKKNTELIFFQENNKWFYKFELIPE